MSTVDLKFHVKASSTILAEGNSLVPGKCLLCQKQQPAVTRTSEDGDSKYVWVCYDCRQIDNTDILLGNDLKLRNLRDIFDSETLQDACKTDISTRLAQLKWAKLRHTVRCLYRKAGTDLATGIDQMLDIEKMKVLVHELCENGPQQLYNQLETQGREYVEEVKFHLLEHLLCHPSSIGIPQHAREFAQTFLDEYEQLLCATSTLRSFLVELEEDHMAKFGISWMLVNQHLFHQVVYSDPIIQKSLPGVCIQLKYGELQQNSSSTTTTANSKSESYTSVYFRIKSFEEEMVLVEQTWIRAIVALASFVNESEQNCEEWGFFNNNLLQNRESVLKRSSDDEDDEAMPDIPSSLLGHKKLFIKHSIPAPPIHSKSRTTASSNTDIMKTVKVDQLASGSIEIKATSLSTANDDESGCICECTACTTLMDSLASNSSTDDEDTLLISCSPIENNWVQIPDEMNDLGCDSSTQTMDDTDDRHESSERRNSTSSSSSKDSEKTDKPKYCACCYCELVGHPNPSLNNIHSNEVAREKLRKKFEFRRNPEKMKRELCLEHQNNFHFPTAASMSASSPKKKNVVDNRSLEELLSFIEGSKGEKEQKRKKKRNKVKDVISVKSPGGVEDQAQPKNRKISGESISEDVLSEQTPPTTRDSAVSIEANVKQAASETSADPDKKNDNKQNSSSIKQKLKLKLDNNRKELFQSNSDCVFRKLFNQKRFEIENFSLHLEKFKNLTQEQKVELFCGSRLDTEDLFSRQQEFFKSLNIPDDISFKTNKDLGKPKKPEAKAPTPETTSEEKSKETENKVKQAKNKQQKKQVKEDHLPVQKQMQQQPQQNFKTDTKPGTPKLNKKEDRQKRQLPAKPVSKQDDLPKPSVKAKPDEPAKNEKKPDTKVKCNEEMESKSITKKKYKKKKKRNESLDDIFLPRCNIEEMDFLDESERELENFKRFCMDTQPLKTRPKIQLNWKTINLNSKRPI